MKKVFLIGDSIRMGYEKYVSEILAEKALVYSPEDNCRFAGYTYIGIPYWKSIAGNPEEVSVVHWNNGSWDCTHFHRDSDPYNTVEEYAQWLRRVYVCIRQHFPNAQVVFATTTYVYDERQEETEEPRSNGEIEVYNREAMSVMRELGVPVNDLAALSAGFPMEYFSDTVHFGAIGSRLLAEAVSETIIKYL